ncbi:MAG TPA: hypothetical protein VFX24_16400 [Ktedonobacterales bacterium]|nr:hypothetical protein [Ktedonobacterales bacterium]
MAGPVRAEVLREHEWGGEIGRQRGYEPRERLDAARRGTYDHEVIERLTP